jgi:hypothetical protein
MKTDHQKRRESDSNFMKFALTLAVFSLLIGLGGLLVDEEMRTTAVVQPSRPAQATPLVGPWHAPQNQSEHHANLFPRREGLPDLVISDVCREGKDFYVTVLNRGPGTGWSFFSVQLFADRGADGSPTYEVPAPGVKVRTQPVSINTLKLADGSSGSLRVELDPLRTVREADETNNRESREVFIDVTNSNCHSAPPWSARTQTQVLEEARLKGRCWVQIGERAWLSTYLKDEKCDRPGEEFHHQVRNLPHVHGPDPTVAPSRESAGPVLQPVVRPTGPVDLVITDLCFEDDRYFLTYRNLGAAAPSAYLSVRLESRRGSYRGNFYAIPKPGESFRMRGVPARALEMDDGKPNELIATITAHGVPHELTLNNRLTVPDLAVASRTRCASPPPATGKTMAVTW